MASRNDATSVAAESRLHAVLKTLLIAAILMFISGAEGQSLMDVIDTRQELTVVKSLVDTAGLRTTLSDTSLKATALLPQNEAFATFAISLNLPDVSALNTLGADVLSKMLLYHVIPGTYKLSSLVLSSKRDPWPTLLSTGFPTAAIFSRLTVNGTYVNLAATTITGASGAKAAVVVPDIGAGTNAFVNIVDTVLGFWYNTIEDALAANKATNMSAALRQANIAESALFTPQAAYTVFAPRDAGFSWLNRLNLDQEAINKIVTSHVAAGVASGNIYATTGPIAYDTLIAGHSLNVTNSNGTTNGTVTVTGAMGSSNASVAMIPVGGPTPKSHVYILEQVVYPVYASIWDCLIGNPSTFSSLIDLILYEDGRFGSLVPLLRDGLAVRTMLVPTDQAVASFLAANNYSDLKQLLSTSPRRQFFIKTLIIDAARPVASFITDEVVVTQGEPLNVTLSGASVTFATTPSSKATVTTPYDTPYLYERGYVHALDAVPVPATFFATVEEALGSMPGLTVFASLVNQTGLLGANVSDPAFEGTIVAPTDAAFNALAVSLGLAGSSALLQLDPTALRKLVAFHMSTYPRKIGGAQFMETQSTLLGQYYNPYEDFTRWRILPVSYGNCSTSTVATFTGASANTVTCNIIAGKSFIHIIDAVLPYWYQTIADVLQANNCNKTVQGLVNTGLWTSLLSKDTSYTLFAPTNEAVEAAMTAYGVNLTANTSASLDVLQYHISRTPLAVELGFGPTQQSFTTQGGAGSRVLVAKSTSGATTLTVDGFGSSTRTRVFVVPVGGPVQTSNVFITEDVLMPVYTSIWQVLERNPNYQKLMMMMSNGIDTHIMLKSTTTVGTLFAPNDKAIASFENSQGNKTMDSLLTTYTMKIALAQQHVATVPRTRADLKTGDQLPTLGSGKLTVVVSSGNYRLETARSSVLLVAPSDISVLYGRAYVHSVDDVLIPNEVPLGKKPGGGSGGAATCVPSVALLVFSLLVGRWLLAQGV